MQQRPSIAVLTPNVLTGIGLKTILEKIIPMAEIELFVDFESFAESDAERFFHYFVSAQTFVAHGTFFRSLRGKTIILCGGEPMPAYADMRCIDINTTEEAIAAGIMRMHRSVHNGHHEHFRHKSRHSALAVPDTATPPAAPLTGREAEVLALIARGYINKQIADTLHIGLTTVISHRRNIMEKLGIRSVAGLVIYALSEGYAATEEP